MKKTAACFLLLLFLHFRLSAQVSDNFSDGNFTQNPTWNGNAANFIINPQNQLQANGANATSVIYLSTPSSLAKNTEWNIWLKLSFNPTSTNYTRLYLTSDQADLSGSLNGYYLRIGEDGSADAVDLYRQNGTTSTRILKGIAGRVATAPTVRLKVTLDYGGNWTVYSDNTGGTAFVSEGSVNDNAFTASAFFGIWCSFTATNRTGFLFDDVDVKTASFTPPVEANYKDLIINEILADETPVVGLPAAEFVELYNRSNKTLNLAGFTLSASGSKGTFPGYVFKPGEYLIVCRTADTTAFKPFGKTLGLPGFPALANTGTELSLQSRTGTLVDKVNYNLNWYHDSQKSGGGWSLELIDPDNTCSEETNWTAAVNPAGGTPGKVNSVKTANPDLLPPQLLSISIENARKITAVFNEKIDSASVGLPGVFAIDKGISVASAKVKSIDNKAVELNLAADLVPRTLYTLTAVNLKDLCQNILASPVQLPFALPEAGDSGDVVLSEVLFNPKPNGVDFVEIYNRSDKYVNLANWQLARIDDKGKVTDSSALTTQNLVMFPKTYLAIAADGNVLKTNYPKAREEHFLISKTPPYNDASGTVLLYSHRHKLIDRFDYSEKFHFKLLNEVQGVSLERINPDAFGNTPDNWHSAAATEGYATPGYKNSQAFSPQTSNSAFAIEPKVFTPDEDGYKDFTTFNYAFNNPGNVADIRIFDANGRPVRHLVQNQTLATEGGFQWDGTNDRNEKVRVGLYVVVLQLFELGGTAQTFRETVAVAAKVR